MLSKEERRAVGGSGAVAVTVVDPSRRKYDMVLRKWNSLNQIVINGGWRHLVDSYKLKVEIDSVQV